MKIKGCHRKKNNFLSKTLKHSIEHFKLSFSKYPFEPNLLKEGRGKLIDQMINQTRTEPAWHIPKYRQGTDICAEINYTQPLSGCETGSNWYKTQSQISYFKTRIQPTPTNDSL